MIIWQGAPLDQAHGQLLTTLSDPRDLEGVAIAELELRGKLA